MRCIAHFHSPFATKFGAPKQAGLAPALHGTIVFTSEFDNADYVRGLDEFDYIWVLWEFSANPTREKASPLVRPPLLGGNERMGVFATRSPFRPNPIGLSALRLECITLPNNGQPLTLHVSGADLIDGTPIYDIKPYLPYADAHPTARAGFTDSVATQRLEVIISDEILNSTPWLANDPALLVALRQTLALDPRPHYHHDPTKLYGLTFANHNLRFVVDDKLLKVIEIE